MCVPFLENKGLDDIPASPARAPGRVQGESPGSRHDARLQAYPWASCTRLLAQERLAPWRVTGEVIASRRLPNSLSQVWGRKNFGKTSRNTLNAIAPYRASRATRWPWPLVPSRLPRAIARSLVVGLLAVTRSSCPQQASTAGVVPLQPASCPAEFAARASRHGRSHGARRSGS